MNNCTVCNGTGFVRIEVEINGTKSMATVVCGECGGYSDIEEVMK